MGMKQKVVLTSIVCLFVGVACTRMAMNSSRAEQSFEEKTAERLTVENRTLKTRLARLLDERIPSMESELTLLRTSPKIEPAPPSQTKPAAAEASSDAALKGNIKNASDVAVLLNLEPARQKYFEESYGRLIPKLLEAEKQHTQISRQGGEVEIHISPFPDEGRVLREEWSNLLMGALTSSEQEQYKKLKLDQVLFPREIGIWDRTMVYAPQENAVWPKLENGNRLWPAFYERWTKPGEKEVDPATRWIWAGPEAYRWYSHLLDPSECKVREEGR